MKLPKSRRAAGLILVAAALLTAAGCGSSTSSPYTTPVGDAAGVNNRGEVPATAFLSVTENYFAKGGHPPGTGSAPLRYSVTNKQVIAQLADLINGLPTAPDQGVTPCPSSMAPAYGLDFKDLSNSAPSAEVSIECFGVMVTLHGQRKPILSTREIGQNQLLAKVDALLADSRPKN